jgi:hypothetical protein
MNAKRLVLGTLVGTLTLSGTGYLVFGVAFPRFYTDFMTAGSATGVTREPPLLWAVVVGMLSYGLLVTLAVWGRGDSPTVRAGALAGAIVSFLLWLTADFMLYGISNVGNVMGILVEPVVEAVLGAVTGGLVAALFRKMPSASTRGSGAESGRTDKAAA